MEYAENGTDPVATYTAVTPRADQVYWSLAGGSMPDLTGDDMEVKSVRTTLADVLALS